MARKLQEDPLYIIKKKEIESRSQILKNPVKLKQLQELVSISHGVVTAFMLDMCSVLLVDLCAFDAKHILVTTAKYIVLMCIHICSFN
jgi:hypothetical protein